MMGTKTLEARFANGAVKEEGDASILKQLASTMVDFDPHSEIMPGTRRKPPRSHMPIHTRRFHVRSLQNRPKAGGWRPIGLKTSLT